MTVQEEVFEIGKGFNNISDFSDLIERIKDKKIVMLGESTHGSQDFYSWRSLLSKELLINHGFNFIAVEGDWPACEKINQFIQAHGDGNSTQVISAFSRWPTWMWANTAIKDLAQDLKEINSELGKSVGFHGLDVYSLYESIDEIIMKLQTIDPSLAATAKQLYGCLEPYRDDERSYAHSLFKMPKGCEEEVLKVLTEFINKIDPTRYFDVFQNARIIKNAESYYRSLISFSDESWNIRDHHMQETLDNLLIQYGANSKAIVWAHNTHIGDYRATNMASHGQVNLGGLSREKYGEDEVALIGFTTYQGTVLASDAWDGAIQVMDIPPAIEGSLEYKLHQAIPQIGYKNYYLDFSSIKRHSTFFHVVGHRAIGVVYHPEHEHRGNYVPTIPARRYDALVYFDETHALTPIQMRAQKNKFPETYPYGDQV
jgi:erythromycin esterase-like protein